MTLRIAILMLFVSGLLTVSAPCLAQNPNAGPPSDRAELLAQRRAALLAKRRLAIERRLAEQPGWRDMTPQERRQMREAARRRWRDASPTERREMRDEMRAWRQQAREDLSFQERREMRRRPGLPGPGASGRPDRAELRERLGELSPGERHACATSSGSCPPISAVSSALA